MTFHKGQRVRTKLFFTSAKFEGEILSIYSPPQGQPYTIVVDQDGQPHHRWFHELEPIEPSWEPVAPFRQGSNDGLTIGFKD